MPANTTAVNDPKIESPLLFFSLSLSLFQNFTLCLIVESVTFSPSCRLVLRQGVTKNKSSKNQHTIPERVSFVVSILLRKGLFYISKMSTIKVDAVKIFVSPPSSFQSKNNRPVYEWLRMVVVVVVVVPLCIDFHAGIWLTSNPVFFGKGP